MPTINLTVPHSLDKKEALTRVQNLLTQTKAQFADQISDLRETWADNKCSFSFCVARFHVTGVMIVDANKVNIHGNLPFLAGIFKSKIESIIQTKAREILA